MKVFLRRDLLPGIALFLRVLERQFVGDVVLIDAADVGCGLKTDLLSGHQFDVVKPYVRVESALLRQFAHLRDFLRPGIVARKGEERAVLFAEVLVREIARYE